MPAKSGFSLPRASPKVSRGCHGRQPFVNRESPTWPLAVRIVAGQKSIWTHLVNRTRRAPRSPRCARLYLCSARAFREEASGSGAGALSTAACGLVTTTAIPGSLCQQAVLAKCSTEVRPHESSGELARRRRHRFVFTKNAESRLGASASSTVTSEPFSSNGRLRGSRCSSTPDALSQSTLPSIRNLECACACASHKSQAGANRQPAMNKRSRGR
jgi:hypothetical protein